MSTLNTRPTSFAWLMVPGQVRTATVGWGTDFNGETSVAVVNGGTPEEVVIASGEAAHTVTAPATADDYIVTFGIEGRDGGLRGTMRVQETGTSAPSDSVTLPVTIDAATIDVDVDLSGATAAQAAAITALTDEVADFPQLGDGAGTNATTIPGDPPTAHVNINPPIATSRTSGAVSVVNSSFAAADWDPAGNAAARPTDLVIPDVVAGDWVDLQMVMGVQNSTAALIWFSFGSYVGGVLQRAVGLPTWNALSGVPVVLTGLFSVQLQAGDIEDGSVRWRPIYVGFGTRVTSGDSQSPAHFFARGPYR